MKTRRILVAEDSEVNRYTLVHLLKILGFEVVDFDNGLSAWQMLSQGEHEIDAILSDIMMPKMDGLTLLKNCRDHDKCREIPFLLITAVTEKEYMAAAKAGGVNGYIVKPVTFERLKTKMIELFPDLKFKDQTGS
jgi:CheY-like chemotaxis protein